MDKTAADRINALLNKPGINTLVDDDSVRFLNITDTQFAVLEIEGSRS